MLFFRCEKNKPRFVRSTRVLQPSCSCGKRKRRWEIHVRFHETGRDGSRIHDESKKILSHPVHPRARLLFLFFYFSLTLRALYQRVRMDARAPKTLPRGDGGSSSSSSSIGGTWDRRNSRVSIFDKEEALRIAWNGSPSRFVRNFLKRCGEARWIFEHSVSMIPSDRKIDWRLKLKEILKASQPRVCQIEWKVCSIEGRSSNGFLGSRVGFCLFDWSRWITNCPSIVMRDIERPTFRWNYKPLSNTLLIDPNVILKNNCTRSSISIHIGPKQTNGQIVGFELPFDTSSLEFSYKCKIQRWSRQGEKHWRYRNACNQNILDIFIVWKILFNAIAKQENKIKRDPRCVHRSHL